MSHVPVLLEEALNHLVQTPSGTFVDGTYGRGGHARALLGRLADDARLVALDRDLQACADGARLAEQDARFSIHHARFSEMARVLDELGIDNVAGILLDIGVSSPQLDEAQRGFSFSQDGPLDMRMDTSSGQSAADWLNQAEADEISDVIRTHGEERFARRIAAAIVAARPLSRTSELKDLVAAAVPARLEKSGKHPATRTFQAIRIFINEEHLELERGLDAAFELLASGGRLAVITFHSLEDRVVKQRFNRLSRGPDTPRHIPLRADEVVAPARLIGRAIRPTAREVAQNARARSATLRVVEKR